MTTDYHTALTTSGAATAEVINKPLQQLDDQLSDMDDGTHAWSAPVLNVAAVDGTTIGGTTPAAGTFSTLTVNNDLNFGSAMFAELRTPQAIGNTTTTLIDWNLERLDTDSVFDLSTNIGRWTPSVAGTYMLIAGITNNAGFTIGPGQLMIISLYENAGLVAQATTDSQGLYGETASIATLVDTPGNSYFEAKFYHSSGGTIVLDPAIGECYFGGFRVY